MLRIHVSRVRSLFGVVNGLSRSRRKKRFERSVKKHSDRPIIVTEGDSWFQFPFLLKDVIDNLSDHFSIYSVGSAGARTSEMVYEKTGVSTGFNKG